jgi:hypothetical protein
VHPGMASEPLEAPEFHDFRNSPPSRVTGATQTVTIMPSSLLPEMKGQRIPKLPLKLVKTPTLASAAALVE